MTLRHYYREIDNTLVDMSAYAPRVAWVAQSKAEEGSVGSWTITLDDPYSDLEIVGHRGWFIEDDESEDEDDIIWAGYVGKQTITRVQGDGRRTYGSLGRVITLELYDANTMLTRTIMRGSDTDRPIETDVERMEWLLSTAEAATIIDTTTYVDTSGPVNMDAAPLRGTYLGQVITDCAGASGKNFYAWFRKVSGIRTLTLWYGRDSLSDYTSPFLITNDPADISEDAIDNGTATVWKLSDDATLERSPERQYCGNYLTYEGGATYRHNATTHAAAFTGSAHRDMVSNVALVKTQAKAQARADRQLLDVQDQDIRIRTTLRGIPQERVTLCKAGMRLQIKGTHWAPDCDDWHYARILSAQPQPFGPGLTWDIDLELTLGEESPGPTAPDYGGTVFAGIIRSRGNALDQRGPLKYANTYDIGGGGWYTAPTNGPIAIDAGVPNPEADGYVYDSMTVSEPMIVRIHARAWITGVYGGTRSAVLNVYVNGSLVDTASTTCSNCVGGLLDVDVRDYHLDAGDIVSIDSAGSTGDGGADTMFWTNNGVNDSYLLVGRGQTYDGSDLVFEGP